VQIQSHQTVQKEDGLLTDIVGVGGCGECVGGCGECVGVCTYVLVIISSYFAQII
jgi:ferredoxin